MYTFPANLDFDNPLSEIQIAKGHFQFNLRLKNGVNTNFKFSDKSLDKEKYLKFLPKDGEVPLETIQVSYDKKDHQIYGFRFLDRAGALILVTDKFDNKDEDLVVQEIKLGEGERWLGFTTGLVKENYGFFYGMSLITAKRQ